MIRAYYLSSGKQGRIWNMNTTKLFTVAINGVGLVFPNLSNPHATVFFKPSNIGL